MRSLSAALVGIVVVGALSSCGSSQPKPAGGQYTIDGLKPPPGERVYHEWQEVWVGDNAVERVHQGYLDRMFTLSDLDGHTVVRDRTHEILGFILPSGRALLVESRAGEEPKLRDLGLMGTQDAIRALLRVKGQVELRLDVKASTAPGSDEAPATSPKSQPEPGPGAAPKSTVPGA